MEEGTRPDAVPVSIFCCSDVIVSYFAFAKHCNFDKSANIFMFDIILGSNFFCL